MTRHIFTDDYTETAYWLNDIEPYPQLGSDLPNQVDVVVVGSGYTGLHAALQTARAGRSTLVLESQHPGWGCSTRNGGQISTSVKPSVNQLAKKYGLDKARAIRREGESALQWIGQFVTEEGIECDFLRNGRFHAAHTPEQFDLLQQDAEVLRREEGINVYAVPRSEQLAELGSDAYYGGLVFKQHASLHPGKYHRGLFGKCIEAGVSIVPFCTATHIERKAQFFLVRTDKGVVQANDVIVATNGYTGKLTPWLQRRVIPIGSYVIATERLPEDLVSRLFPTNRIASDSCKVVYYYRTSPDKQRILFGGRVSAKETNPRLSAPKLFADMCRLFPELNDYGISHAWMGKVAYTFDELAHTGQYQGIHYAMGYCGSGVSMASYLGFKLGLKVLRQSEGKTAFDDLNFPSRPFYTGNPWFLPPVVSWYRWRDSQQRLRAAKANDSATT